MCDDKPKYQNALESFFPGENAEKINQFTNDFANEENFFRACRMTPEELSKTLEDKMGDFAPEDICKDLIDNLSSNNSLNDKYSKELFDKIIEYFSGMWAVQLSYDSIKAIQKDEQTQSLIKFIDFIGDLKLSIQKETERLIKKHYFVGAEEAYTEYSQNLLKHIDNKKDPNDPDDMSYIEFLNCPMYKEGIRPRSDFKGSGRPLDVGINYFLHELHSYLKEKSSGDYWPDLFLILEKCVELYPDRFEEIQFPNMRTKDHIKKRIARFKSKDF